MSFSRALRVSSNLPLTFLSILIVLCLLSAVNWSSQAANATATTAPAVAAVPVLVSLRPDVNGALGSIVKVPITVSDVTGLGVLAYDLQVTFDPAVLRPASTPYDKAGTVSSDMVITPNPNHTGHLIISAFQANYATGSGILLNLLFVVVGSPGQTSGLTFEDYTDPIPRFHYGFSFNAGTPQANTANNRFAVMAPTVAAVNVRGEVLSSDGQAVSGATVSVTGGTTTVRAITDRNGLYEVDNLLAGGFYTVTPTRANYTFAPSQRSVSLVGTSTNAVFTGLPDATESANPLDTPEYFVRQQYLDFLSREPDQGGLDYWSAQLAGCNGETDCLRQRRIGVSAAFFVEQEFQQTGSFVYGLYTAAYGRKPQYAEYTSDREQVVGGADSESRKQVFAESFIERAEFATAYQTSTSGASFVDSLLGSVQRSSGVDLSTSRESLINLYDSGSTQTNRRSLVLRALTENQAVKQANYNAAFVLAEYFGYLRRDPDQGGYNFWLNILDHSAQDYRGMVCSMITSTEYQVRFVTAASHSNAECAP